MIPDDTVNDINALRTLLSDHQLVIHHTQSDTIDIPLTPHLSAHERRVLSMGLYRLILITDELTDANRQGQLRFLVRMARTEAFTIMQRTRDDVLILDRWVDGKRTQGLDASFYLGRAASSHRAPTLDSDVLNAVLVTLEHHTKGDISEIQLINKGRIGIRYHRHTDTPGSLLQFTDGSALIAAPDRTAELDPVLQVTLNAMDRVFDRGTTEAMQAAYVILRAYMVEQGLEADTNLTPPH